MYFLGEDQELIRVPFGPFEKALLGKSGKVYPEFAGKRMKGILVFLDTKDKRPHRVRHVDYMLIGFDDTGRIDSKEREEAIRVAINMIAWDPDPKDILESLRPDLTSLKYKDKFRWQPSQAELQTINAALIRQ